jgi:undecaprenyl diphosphate synthase
MINATNMSFKDKLDRAKLPSHVAIIMDGNGRWAKQKGKFRIFGHKNGVKSVRDTVEAAAEIGIKFLTLYAFSTENWSRPKKEVDALMSLLISTLGIEIKTLMDNNVRLLSIGDTESLPKKVLEKLQNTINKTAGNNGLSLVLALSYSSKSEIMQAIRKIAEDIESGKLSSARITEKIFEQHLYTHSIPDPELLIRTSGEYRISNFLLWQIAYSELYFTNVLWPDFRKEDFYQALHDFQNRERRFGMTSEQIKSRQKK